MWNGTRLPIQSGRDETDFRMTRMTLIFFNPTPTLHVGTITGRDIIRYVQALFFDGGNLLDFQNLADYLKADDANFYDKI